MIFDQNLMGIRKNKNEYKKWSQNFFVWRIRPRRDLLTIGNSGKKYVKKIAPLFLTQSENPCMEVFHL